MFLNRISHYTFGTHKLNSGTDGRALTIEFKRQIAFFTRVNIGIKNIELKAEILIRCQLTGISIVSVGKVKINLCFISLLSSYSAISDFHFRADPEVLC